MSNLSHMKEVDLNDTPSSLLVFRDTPRCWFLEEFFHPNWTMCQRSMTPTLPMSMPPITAKCEGSGKLYKM